jgi:hypothetical protein
MRPPGTEYATRRVSPGGYAAQPASVLAYFAFPTTIVVSSWSM